MAAVGVGQKPVTWEHGPSPSGLCPEGAHSGYEVDWTYLGMDAEPATVKRLFAEARCTAHLILPSGGIDDLQVGVPNCPIDTEVWGFPWLSGFCIADP